jgi:hypothetical protein
MWNAEKQVQVNFIKVLGVVILCIASLAVLLAVVLDIAALFLGGVPNRMIKGGPVPVDKNNFIDSSYSAPQLALDLLLDFLEC